LLSTVYTSLNRCSELALGIDSIPLDDELMRQSDPDGICILNEEVFSGRRISMDHRLQLAACTVTEASAPHLWLPKEGERPATPRLSSSLLDCIMLSLFGEDFTRFTMAFGVAAVRLLVYHVVNGQGVLDRISFT
jgi:hypothetical protein